VRCGKFNTESWNFAVDVLIFLRKLKQYEVCGLFFKKWCDVDYFMWNSGSRYHFFSIFILGEGVVNILPRWEEDCRQMSYCNCETW
jgi:hypothetical protein